MTPHRRTRNAIYEKYGAKCACCGYAEDTRFLTIDHIGNSGGKHRKWLAENNLTIEEWVVIHNFPDCLQILCVSCNYAKSWYGNVCPHTLPKEVLNEYDAWQCLYCKLETKEPTTDVFKPCNKCMQENRLEIKGLTWHQVKEIEKQRIE